MAILNLFEGSFDIDVPVVEGYDAENANIDAIIESFDSDLAVMEAIYKHDMLEMKGLHKIRTLTESKQEDDDDDDYDMDLDDDDDIKTAKENLDTVLEASAKEIWDKMINGLKSLWAKIKSYLDAAIRFLMQHLATNKAFGEKYGAQAIAKQGTLGDFKHNGYNWKDIGPLGKFPSMEKHINMKGASNKSTEELKTATDELTNNKEAKLNTIRGTLAGESGPVTNAEFEKKIINLYRDDTKNDHSIDITEAVGFINKGFSDCLNSYKTAKADVDNSFKNIIGQLNNLRADEERIAKRVEDGGSEKASQIKALANANISIFKGCQAIWQRKLNIYKSIIKEYNDDCKSAVVAVLRHKPGK